MNNNLMRSYVDLRRNFSAYPFESTMLDSDRNELLERVNRALDETDDTWIYYSMREIDPKGRLALEDIALVDSLWLKKQSVILFIREDQKALVCLHDEDHVLVRVEADPEDTLPAIREAKTIAKTLSERSTFAKDERIGWLTAKPQYAGTGVQLSHILHLPMLSMMQQMKNVEQRTNAGHRFEITSFDMSEKNPAAVYRFSGLFTAYNSSESLAVSTRQAVEEICAKEENLRRKLLKYASRSIYLDQIYRAYGILLYARRLTQEEFLSLWSRLRLGACAGLIPVDINTVDSLLALTSRPKLIEQADGVLDEHAIHFNRADTVRAALHGGT